MDKLFIAVGGRPGIDCDGFCSFCFYKNVDYSKLDSLDFGCVNCPPDKIGCHRCHHTLTGVKNDFIPLYKVLMELETRLAMESLWDSLNKNFQLVVYSEADIFHYPDIVQLVSIIKDSQIPIHLSYTSGKVAQVDILTDKLISLGLDEITFSSFSTDPEIRRRWMGDKNPVEAVESLKLFCENIDVNASVVVVPGVNDGERLFQTASDLEEWGVKNFLLRRFANFKYQGLILNDEQPIIEGINPQSMEEYVELVKKITDEFSFRVMSYPYYDYKKDFPFAILKRKNREYLEVFPKIDHPATIITGRLAGPYLEKFFELVDDEGLVNVVDVDKEVADLITHEDLITINLDEVKGKVVIPLGALVHDKRAQEILSKDGTPRKVVRGPLNLTYIYHECLDDFSKDELIEYELKSFKELIDKINHG